jgi:guanosine-3',5'-bis(diphosphate) 3'-pyrophosphohydrolase
MGLMTYLGLRNRIKQERPDLDLAAVDKAYEFARRFHEGQQRYSGEPYIVHPVAATDILLQLQPDLSTVQACLLHDVTEDTVATLEDVEEAFGEEVARLVKGCEKLAVVKVRGTGLQDERWKQLFLSMASDVRIVFIKLSDRLHNMRTLQHVPKEKRRRIAHESLHVHAAIASRLGIYQIKSDLEDLCFRYLHPDAFGVLSEELAKHRERSEQCMAFAVSQVEQLLVREDIPLDHVQGRLKHLYSIYQKMLKKDTRDLSDIHDLFAVRVILPDDFEGGGERIDHLYKALSVLQSHYLPVEDRFKDYVAAPKVNGYRSLHTTLEGLGADLYSEPTEVQIRSLAMHKEAELGIASHTNYKLGKSGVLLDQKRHMALHQALQKVHALVQRESDIAGIVTEWVERYQHMLPEDRRRVEQLLLDKGLEQTDLDGIRRGRSQEVLTLQPNVEQQLAWIRGLAEDNVARAELDLYPGRIFVLTPGRDVIQLPRGATPIDFAYAVHTEVGHKMVHAKVDGRIVPLDHELQNGDSVEVGTKPNGKPNRYWLSIAKSGSARAKIRNWFNKQDREGNIVAGRSMLNEQLKQIGEKVLDDKLLLLKDYAGKPRTLQEREQLLEALGLGSMGVSQMMKTLFPSVAKTVQSKRQATVAKVEELSGKVLVTGEPDLPVVLSACCKPRPPKPIIAYVARGRHIRVHLQNCRELMGLDGERFVSAQWG